MSQNEHLSDALYDYIMAHNPPVDTLMQELIDETATMGPIQDMQLGVDQAAFLAFMVGLLNARFVVEIGTFTGLSAMAMARALPPDGRMLCCDVSHEFTAIARRYWARAGVDDRIELVIAPAAETLAALDPETRIDLAFIDADKPGYVDYYEQLVPRLSAHGVIIADNVFMGARGPDDSSEAMRAFAHHAQVDARTETVVVSIGDGFTLTRLIDG